MEDEVRKRFEVWYGADAMPAEADWFKRDPLLTGCYEDDQTQHAWEGYQAGVRNSVTKVYLPKITEDILGVFRNSSLTFYGTLHGKEGWQWSQNAVDLLALVKEQIFPTS